MTKIKDMTPEERREYNRQAAKRHYHKNKSIIRQYHEDHPGAKKFKDMDQEERKEYARQAFRRWFSNPENHARKLAKNRAWKAAHKNRATNTKEYNQAYYQTRRAELRARHKAWYWAHRDEVLAKQQAERDASQPTQSDLTLDNVTQP